MSIVMKWNVDRWAEWAEKTKMDTRCINFMLMNEDVVKGAVNPRSLTNFFNSISSIPSFNEQLPLIQNLGEGSVGPEVATLFSSFIHNKMDQWITPRDILLHEDEAGVIKSMKDLFISEAGEYEAARASAIVTRLINFTLLYAEKNPITQEHIQRVTVLIKTADLITNDLTYHLVKKLLAGNKQKFKMLLVDSEIQEIATK